MLQKRGIRIFPAVFFLLVFCLPALPGAANTPEPQSAYLGLSDLLKAVSLIRKTYVDAEKVSDQQLFKAAISGMLKELDPYCVYETKDVLRNTQEETKGEMTGIGVGVVFRNHILTVETVVPGGPAEKAGVRPGDQIQEIDGTEPEDLPGSIQALRGKTGETVRLRIYRPSADAVKEIAVVRAVIALPSIRGIGMLNSDTGYLRIVQFSLKTPQELDQALEKLTKDGMKQLVIDLRNNPGGLLGAARDVCSRFLKPDQPVVSVEGREKKHFQHHKSVKCKSYPELPLVILVNRNTASAAEIVTACLQDHKRAVVIGEQTFGKGVVQTLIPFRKEEALRITTAKYYTPSRRVIQDNGIVPDIVIPMSIAQHRELSAGLNQNPGSLRHRNLRDLPLERALEILKALHLLTPR